MVIVFATSLVLEIRLEVIHVSKLKIYFDVS